MPLIFEDNNTQNNWTDLLSILGASTKIIPEHIITNIQSIIEDDSDKNAIVLLNYISSHFECFEEMKYKGKNIFKYLSDSAWIPAEKPKNNTLAPGYEYKKLRKSSELILKHNYKIAGGVHYTISKEVKLGKKDENGEFNEKSIEKIIGLIVNLPNESIFESFRCLLKNDCKQQESKVLDFAKEFYKYLGRSNILKDDIPDDITERSVFINGYWQSSSKVFQKSINLEGIFSWDDLVASEGKESLLAKGLIKLGVLELPDNDYLVSYLNDLPQSQSLNKQQLKDAKVILNKLQNNLEELDIDDIPLLSHSNQLFRKNKLYIKDLPSYENSDRKNDQLEFCQQQFAMLAKHFSVVSLAESITPNLDKDNSKEPEEANNSWNDYIRSDPLKLAILRLIYHEGKISDNDIKKESVDEILPSNVILMDSLVVRYFIKNDWIYDDMDTTAYQNIENMTLYLLNQDDDEDMCESIAKFISDTSELNRDSCFLINRIIRNKFDDSEKVRDFLDKKNIKSLPEKIELDEGFSLYSNNSMTEKPGVDEDGSFNNHPEDSVTQSNSNTLREKQSDAQSGVDIPPPIEPKKSNSSNMSGESKSFGDHNSHNNNMNQGSQEGDIVKFLIQINLKKL